MVHGELNCADMSFGLLVTHVRSQTLRRQSGEVSVIVTGVELTHRVGALNKIRSPSNALSLPERS